MEDTSDSDEESRAPAAAGGGMQPGPPPARSRAEATQTGAPCAGLLVGHAGRGEREMSERSEGSRSLPKAKRSSDVPEKRLKTRGPAAVNASCDPKGLCKARSRRRLVWDTAERRCSRVPALTRARPLFPEELLPAAAAAPGTLVPGVSLLLCSEGRLTGGSAGFLRAVQSVKKRRRAQTRGLLRRRLCRLPGQIDRWLDLEGAEFRDA